MIRQARPDEAAAVSDLALRSKGYWGYSDEFLEACREELTYTPEQCAAGEVFVAERDGRLLGMSAIEGKPPEGEVVAMFVDLDAMGQGVGGGLIRHLLDESRTRGFTSLTLAADPGAEPFYVHHGATRIGEIPSGSIAGRVLPHLRFALS